MGLNKIISTINNQLFVIYRIYAENEEPQPQVVVALGFLITN